jgi:hypothetical protein
MANDAFALSPISARASLPSEEDYEAIREAFMETSRGRWFLNEYARRNRNADTSMVLDAVARIEEALATQNQPPPPPPPVEDRRAELLAAIASAVAKAEESAANALNKLGVEDGLAPIRKGARIIKEISWRWREIGADGRICDLIDSQVSAIDAGCNQIADIDPRTALRAAFEIIKTSIEGFSETAAPGAARGDDAVAEAPSTTDEVPAATAKQINATAEPDHAELALAARGEGANAAIAKPAERVGETDAYDAADEAILDIVAAEMSAPDPDEVAVAAAKPRAHVTEPPLIEPFVVASEPQPKAMPPAWPRPQPGVAALPPAEPSLGATILATGILPRPKPLASDPLAPIRRMSQAEKIALFS